MSQNINRVVITGNLTRDPESRTTSSGTAICNLRIASNSRVKRDSGWTDKPNYFDVTVFGSQGENCQRFLAKGRPVCIDGRLDWREWESNGTKHQAVQILAESVQFLSDGQGHSGGGGGGNSHQQAPVAVGPPPDDDIPF